MTEIKFELDPESKYKIPSLVILSFMSLCLLWMETSLSWMKLSFRQEGVLIHLFVDMFRTRGRAVWWFGLPVRQDSRVQVRGLMSGCLSWSAAGGPCCGVLALPSCEKNLGNNQYTDMFIYLCSYRLMLPYKCAQLNVYMQLFVYMSMCLKVITIHF